MGRQTATQFYAFETAIEIFIDIVCATFRVYQLTFYLFSVVNV